MKGRAWHMAALALVLLAACARPPLERGSRLAEDVYWRLNLLGDGEHPPSDSDSVQVRVRLARPKDAAGSLYSTERWFAMGQPRGMAMFFKLMHQGDSATVLLRSHRVPWAELGAQAPPPTADTGWVQMELSMLAIRTLEESRAWAMAALMGRNESDQARILEDFFARDDRPWKHAMGLWYVLDTLADKGARVRSGEQVTLAYRATFLDNGEVFDQQTAEEGGLTFRLGDPDQVITGLEAACHLLPAKGGTGWFVLPADLAFGPKGSAAAIVPPWTPVLYQVTVLPQPTAEAGKPH